METKVCSSTAKTKFFLFSPMLNDGKAGHDGSGGEGGGC